ncbi:MAG: hypothetical protein LM590_15010 [Thermofilum sp.]|nr:hypothetical protein [Thermofilum sp.]
MWSGEGKKVFLGGGRQALLAACRLPGSLRIPPLFALCSGALACRSVGIYALVAYRCMSRALGAYALLHWLDVLTHPSGGPLFGFIVTFVPGVHLRGYAKAVQRSP